MKMGPLDVLMAGADLIFQNFPFSPLNNQKESPYFIVAHRGGCHGSPHVENTMEAFLAAFEAGVWGIEFDIRWTKDLVPVVHHDASLKRLFNCEENISHIAFDDLRKRFPLIPSLKEVNDKFGKKLHFMIEIKQDGLWSHETSGILEETLKPLKVIEDYHFLAIDLECFKFLKQFPSQAKFPVAFFDVKQKVEEAIKEKYAGVLGHYLLITHNQIERLNEHQLIAGTGYVRTPSLLAREVRKGCQWIFTNHAQEIMENHSKFF